MSLDALKEAMPEYAKDIKLNLSSVLAAGGAPGLSEKQIAGSALAAAYATNNEKLIELMEAHAQQSLTAEDMQGVKAAAVIMGMNNVYYRTLHLVSDQEYATMPTKLRMNIIGNPGIDKADFEAYSLAVSVINACGYCIDAHANKLVNGGFTKEGIQSLFRIAAVVNGAATALNTLS